MSDAFMRSTNNGPQPGHTQWRANLNMWPAECHLKKQNRTEHRGNTHTHLTINIKIPDTTSNGIRDAGLEYRDSTDEVTATDTDANESNTLGSMRKIILRET